MRVMARLDSAASWLVVCDGIFFQDRREGRERMAGDVKAEQFLFVREQFVLRPFRQLSLRFGAALPRAPPICRTACPVRAAGPG